MRRALLAIAGLTACSGEPAGPPGAPFAIEIAGALALPQTGTTHLAAFVVDNRGRLVPDQPVTWRSNDTTMIRVDAQGLVTAIGPTGLTSLSVFSGELERGAYITVLPVITEVVPRPARLTMEPGTFLDVPLVVLDAIGNPVSPPFWPLVTNTSSDTSVARVNGSGRVRAVGAGTATIAITMGSITVQVPVTVTAFTHLATFGSTYRAAVSSAGEVWSTTIYPVYRVRRHVLGSGTIETVDEENGSSASGVVFNAAGSRAWVSGGGRVKEYDVATRAHVRSLNSNVYLTYRDVTLSSDESALYVASDAGVQTFTLASGTEGPLWGFNEGANHIAAHPSQPRIYASLRGLKRVVELDAASGTVTRTWTFTEWPQDVAVSADGRLYVVTEFLGNGTGMLYELSIATGDTTGMVPLASNALQLAISPDGTRLALTRPGAGAVEIYNRATFDLERTIVNAGPPNGVAFDAVGSRLAIAVGDGWLSIVQ